MVDQFQELTDALQERAGFYQSAAGLYFQELPQEAIDALKANPLPTNSGNEKFDSCSRDINRAIAFAGPNPRQYLASDFARVFLSAGSYQGEAAHLFESVYTGEDKVIMGDARDKVRKIFKQQEVLPDQSLNLPEDHISFEFEFMALLSRRAMDALALNDAGALKENLVLQSGFLKNHILNWLGQFGAKVDEVSTGAFYPAATKLIQAFCEEDLQWLNEQCLAVAA